MREFNFEIKKGAKGLWDDGRKYEVLSIPTITICTNGSLIYGDIELNIDEEYYKIRISEFIEHVQTIGNLTIKNAY